MMNFSDAFEAAKLHARQQYPAESCGLVVDGVYIPMTNAAWDESEHKDQDCSCRLCTFRISKIEMTPYLGRIQMILHSHPDSPIFPSRSDMEGQIASGVPWGVVSLDESRISDFEVWGDQLPIAPLLGRQFLHGIRDCYSTIRDTYRMGHDALKQAGITSEWPFESTILREVPRDDAWWDGDDDFYNILAGPYGWEEISGADASPGDVFLSKIKSNKFNHGGVLISKDLILHHLPGRMSRREPSGIWARAAGRWLRYTGAKK